MSVKRNVRRASPEKLLHALLVELRTEVLELREGSLELCHRGILVTLTPIRDSQQHPGLRGLVRRAHVLPRVARLSQGTGRCVQIALEERDLTSSEMHGGIKRGSSPAADQVGVDNALELVGGSTRVFMSPAASEIST